MVGWGESALEAAFEARDTPEKSAGKILRSGWNGSPPQRVGAYWPGRDRRMIALNATPIALVQALELSPPVIWKGRTEGKMAHDVVQWGGLRARPAFLDAIPLDPPPDR